MCLVYVLSICVVNVCLSCCVTLQNGQTAVDIAEKIANVDLRNRIVALLVERPPASDATISPSS